MKGSSDSYFRGLRSIDSSCSRLRPYCCLACVRFIYVLFCHSLLGSIFIFMVGVDIPTINRLCDNEIDIMLFIKRPDFS